MSADQITAIAAAILSLAFSYNPGLRSRYEPLGDEYKCLIMLGLLALVTVSVFAYSRFVVYLGITSSLLICLLHVLIRAIDQAAEHILIHIDKLYVQAGLSPQCYSATSRAFRQSLPASFPPGL